MPRRTPKPQLPQVSARVPQFVVDKLDDLARDIVPLGHPRAFREDIVGALLDAATPEKTAEALSAYNPKLGQELTKLSPPNGKAKGS